MINLIPSYTFDHAQLWKLVSNRNKWLIQIRFIVVTIFLIFLLFVGLIIKLNLSDVQLLGMISISAFILSCNIIFLLISSSSLIKNSPDKYNPLHFALTQIICDLLALGFLTYFTGGIESPFYIFFIFHMIIGSMILPGFVLYTIAIATTIALISLSLSEYLKLIPHNSFGNLLEHPLYNNFNYVLISTISFGIMMIVSAIFSNRIARAHYQGEQELKKALDELQQAEKVKLKYTMGVVHEIKSPIVAAQSYLDLILQKFLGPISSQVEEKLKRVRNRTEEALHIINDILDISRLRLLESFNFEEFDIGLSLIELINKKKAQARTRNISLEFYEQRSYIQNVMGDKKLIEVALSNVLGNAIKYNIENGLVEVVLKDNQARDGVIIEITDTGIGIPQDEKQNIFKEFYRASNVKTKGYEGTGLGLSFVREIISQHKGKISFQSPSKLGNEISPGTTFKIELPYSQL
ncbi:MAG: sensor histidine kinase [Ignavibacteria bacterium]